MRAPDSRVTVVNSILWGNTPRDILFDGEYAPSVRYTAVAVGWPGQGNLRADPLFAGAGRWAVHEEPGAVLGSSTPDEAWIPGDYHLQSQAGRWDSRAGLWVRDLATSPCIDAGDPAIPVGQEPAPNGGRINMGVYGGTAQACKSDLPLGSP